MNEPSSRMPADAVHDPYAALQALSSPAVCGQCGALYADGQWQWSPAPPGAATTTCPACLRAGDRQPAGELTVAAALGRAHRETIVALVRAVEARAKRDHPLQRIMDIVAETPADGALTITTTDPHLARGLGEALQERFRARASYTFAKGEHLLRVEIRP